MTDSANYRSAKLDELYAAGLDDEGWFVCLTCQSDGHKPRACLVREDFLSDHDEWHRLESENGEPWSDDD